MWVVHQEQKPLGRSTPAVLTKSKVCHTLSFKSKLCFVSTCQSVLFLDKFQTKLLLFIENIFYPEMKFK